MLAMVELPELTHLAVTWLRNACRSSLLAATCFVWRFCHHRGCWITSRVSIRTAIRLLLFLPVLSTLTTLPYLLSDNNARGKRIDSRTQSGRSLSLIYQILRLRLHPTFVGRAAEAGCAIFTATGVQVSLDDNDVAWPAAATQSDWTLYPWDIGDFYGTVTIEVDEVDARCILALYVNLRSGGPLVDVLTLHPASSFESPFRVCIVTSDECAPGRRKRREHWERHVPTPRQLYDELWRWATPLKVHLGRYRVEVDI